MLKLETKVSHVQEVLRCMYIKNFTQCTTKVGPHMTGRSFKADLDLPGGFAGYVLQL